MVKITIAYDGGAYVGWQRQPNGVSVQGRIEEALARLEGAPVACASAGRTDAGVHAAGQVVSVTLTCTMSPEVLRRALNAILPTDIRVLVVEEAPADFHARFSARAKTYHYRLLQGGIVSPFERGYLWAVAAPLDLEAMRAAAAQLEGRHDFASFQAAGSDVRDTVRTILRSHWHAGIPDQDMPGQVLVYEITGDGFLRHMVRAIVGTLVDVGCGRRSAASVHDLLEACDRTLAGPTAPAHGLFLASVDYGTMANSFRKPDVARTAICLDSARLAR